MNILITGAAGGIGSTLTLMLRDKEYNISGLDNLNNGYIENLYENGKLICNHFYEKDIRDVTSLEDIVRRENIECVIHLAAITALPSCEVDPCECINVNVAGTASVLNAARLSGARVIFASTSAIYENNTIDEAPFTEDIGVSPRLIYPLSKMMCENLINSYIKNYDLSVTTLRFFNVFGPRQDIYRKSPPLINYIVREVKKNIKLNFFSNGEQTRDYVHVNDVVTLIELCLNNKKSIGEIFNVCTSTGTSVKDIIYYAEEAFGKKIDYSFNEPKRFWENYDKLYHGANSLDEEVIKKEVNKYAIGSYEKAKKILKWQPNTDIKNLMINTMKENYDKLIM